MAKFVHIPRNISSEIFEENKNKKIQLSFNIDSYNALFQNEMIVEEKVLDEAIESLFKEIEQFKNEINQQMKFVKNNINHIKEEDVEKKQKEIDDYYHNNYK